MREGAGDAPEDPSLGWPHLHRLRSDLGRGGLPGRLRDDRRADRLGRVRSDGDRLARHDAGRLARGSSIRQTRAGGRTFYVNSFDGRERYEDFFIQELVPAIDKKYRTTLSVAERGVGGTSMGGYGALHLAMRHADVFGSASAQSAALLPSFPHPLPTDGRWGFYARVLEEPFGNPLNESWWDANNPLHLAEDPERFAHLKLYFDCGDQDRYGFNAGAEALDKILTGKGFAHEYHLRPGGHGWSYLADYMKYALEFHWACFSAAGAKKP